MTDRIKLTNDELLSFKKMLYDILGKKADYYYVQLMEDEAKAKKMEEFKEFRQKWHEQTAFLAEKTKQLLGLQTIAISKSETIDVNNQIIISNLQQENKKLKEKLKEIEN